jgi:hypothetical protein
MTRRPFPRWVGRQAQWRTARLGCSRVRRVLTADRNLSYPQDVSAFDIAVVVLLARSNSIDDLRPLAPQILGALANAKRGRVTLVGG